MANPTAEENGEEFVDELQSLARKHWLQEGKKKLPKFNAKVVDQIFHGLSERSFPIKELLLLDQTLYLENYLWPNFSKSSSDQLVLSIALILTVKSHENLPIWDAFNSKVELFPALFRRVLAMTSVPTMSFTTRRLLLAFVIHAFQSLDVGFVKKELAPLAQIHIWAGLSSDERRNAECDKHPPLRKIWKGSQKRFDAADKATQGSLRFEQSWLYSLIIDFLSILYSPESRADSSVLLYCERFVELMIDLQSQLPTRKYTNALIIDLNVLVAVKLSPLYKDAKNQLLRDLVIQLDHYVHFAVNSYTSAPMSENEMHEAHCRDLAHLQRIAIQHFKDKLTVLALSNYASIDKRDELIEALADLTDEELVNLCNQLHLRTSYPEGTKVPMERSFYLEILVETFQRRESFIEQARKLTIYPNEKGLFDPRILSYETLSGSRPLPLPKLNLQYLTIPDFLYRAFLLSRYESLYQVRSDIEDVLRRMKPQIQYPSGDTAFTGWSKMSIVVPKVSIMEISLPKVGEDWPSMVRGEVYLDLETLPMHARREWAQVRQDDVVFLLSVRLSDKTTNGDGAEQDYAKELGVRCVRSAEIAQVLDDEGRPLRPGQEGLDGRYLVPRRRTLRLRLDARQWKLDNALAVAGKIEDVYDSINVVVRRKSEENNFKSILESIQDLTQLNIVVPSWFESVFLGYDNDMSSSHYENMPMQVKTLDFRDTFLDWEHLQNSFAAKKIVPARKAIQGCQPPYVLTSKSIAKRKPRKRVKTDVEGEEEQVFEVDTYSLPYMGPYPSDVLRVNTVRYTPTQVEAINSGSRPGLTVIIGPPGTGKTDVATQIISNIYHNFPEQRTLLVARSNHALNQLFEKIVALDIADRHLLRLGHGEEGLNTEASFGKSGRVEYFLERRTLLLAEVDRLSGSLGVPGAHGNSCETAGYFNSVYIRPLWKTFQSTVENSKKGQDVVKAFPFHAFFSNAPQPVFAPDIDAKGAKAIAEGCYRHIQKMFKELEDVRPFELLRTSRDRSNYLLTMEARIVALTSTYAAIKHREILELGFKYDNIIMEEAAQITEIESFIPLTLQRPKDDDNPLQRIVLIGDHHQNPPVIQNAALKQMEQSLFTRLVRLGVPAIQLDAQGRARPAIADLYRWRYKSLTDLPVVTENETYLAANAGFRYPFQLINVEDFAGAGESSPSPHFIQNLGEAEYAVAIYQYMRLLGYPAEKITILTTYAGQRALINDVLDERCTEHPLFGLPATVTTVDKYQGDQNDYIILSLVRTKSIGYLRDIRRWVVALSRARLGLYVLGRRRLFETCAEIEQSWKSLTANGDQLEVVSGEMWPTQRKVDESGQVSTIEGLEHMGQHVFAMIEKALKDRGVKMD